MISEYKSVRVSCVSIHIVLLSVDGGRSIQKRRPSSYHARGVYIKINFVLAVQVTMTMMSTQLEYTGVMLSGVNKLTDHVLVQ